MNCIENPFWLLKKTLKILKGKLKYSYNKIEIKIKVSYKFLYTKSKFNSKSHLIFQL